ncbi:serine dehydratase beta chain [Alteribacillus bidgolensis]|uniref:L-serine ammonia-lyase n=1 Tax=Alteribacillus bidgolensis TaxID=930129 RepID=A0A1G8H9I2_9BACI|nr:serine dehydratase beta chain [Alteribacillus bidgolensis]SDI03324.1 L-serine dehydratase [Alteribacillus bidgolensis]
MEFKSCFDIIGPIMVGPSSSHTAGVVSIGNFIYELLGGPPEYASITLYESFSETHLGHGTDKALVGGMLGMRTNDSNIKSAVEIANKRGFIFDIHLQDYCPYFSHPNTVKVEAGRQGYTMVAGGASLGGGLSKIFLLNGKTVDIPISTNENISKLAQPYMCSLKRQTSLGGSYED